MDNHTMHDYLRNLLDHKHLVGKCLNRFTAALFQRAVEHDASKYDPEEFDAYAENLPRFRDVAYGSEAYHAAILAIKPSVDRHVRGNRHHPEFYPGGVSDMDLLDVVEMVCDWIAASQRGGPGPLRLDLQRERFGIDEQLYRIICRTAHVLAPELEIVCETQSISVSASA